MDGGAWKAAVHGVAEGRTWLSDLTFTFHFHALEKEMATHSSSCLENPRDGGAWWAAVYGVAQSRTRLKRLSSSSTSCVAIASVQFRTFSSSPKECPYLFFFFNLFIWLRGLSCGMWDLVPWLGIKPEPPASLEHGVLAAGPPGKSFGLFSS